MVKLTETARQKLEKFLTRIASETYPEPITPLHSQITQKMWNTVKADLPSLVGLEILDVGCGQGVSLEIFVAEGMKVTGITLNQTDVEICQAKGFNVLLMDQSFLDFPDQSFDMIWCRHCLEHSIFPFFTLSEFTRVLRPQGYLYVEVPAPNTSCHHENNPNHYSVLEKSMWQSLLLRSGFVIKNVYDINLSTMAGPDTYWAFTATKP
jgi:2-polyprenyl-3-methyl-5-hydroxy-6-metoxy-1,4-benzoquinol methylase